MAQRFEPEDFGPYRLTHLLGKGGMASVFRALRSGPMGFQKEVAIKRLHSSLSEDESILKALINEARLGGQLKHRNIVEIYEFNKVGNSYYLAMEFIDGWTLDRIMKLSRKHGLPIPPEVALDIAVQICRGLDYAHKLETLDGQEVRLVHRDLKPANIIVARDGSAKIMDFGIAKAQTNLFKTTVGEVTKGTPHYMSPEQVAGDPNLGPASDIFAVGAVVCEMLTGRLLFTGDSLVAILFAVAKAKVGDQLTAADARLPGIARVLSDCLAQEPQARIQSASELAGRLQALRRRLHSGHTVEGYIYDLRDAVTGKTKPTLRTTSSPEGDSQAPLFATLVAPALMAKQVAEKRELEVAREAADAEIESARQELKESMSTLVFADTTEEPDWATSTMADLDPVLSGNSSHSLGAKASPNGTRPKQKETEVSTLVRVLSLILLLVGMLAAFTITLEGQLAPDELSSLSPPGDSTDEPKPIQSPIRTVPLKVSPEASPPPPSAATPSTKPVVQPTAQPATQVSAQPTPRGEAASPPPSPVSKDPGYLKIKAATPYFGWVHINGRKRNGISTPVHSSLSLPPGQHTIRLESSAQPGKLGAPKTVTIEPGKTLVLGRYNFTKEQWQ